tara:strand:+ start:135 stop:518 length:384 start_codon:yes stop_codon:yes gene_type:complete
MYEEFDVCLLAISGDCSKYGMSNKSTFIPVNTNKPTYNLIKKFLRNQTEKSLFLYGSNAFKTPIQKQTAYERQRFNKLVEAHLRLGKELMDAGVFKHKYHVRTKWILEELENGKPLTETEVELSEGY